MTEQGIPLLILFYHPDDPEVKELFKSRVADELRQHRGETIGYSGSSNKGHLCIKDTFQYTNVHVYILPPKEDKMCCD